MARANPSKARARPRSRAKVRRAASGPGGGPTLRTVPVHNRCRGLRFDRRAVATVIHLLDAHAGDIVGLERRRPRRRLPGAHAAGTSRRHQGPGPAVPPGELSVAFLPNAALAALHGRFLGDASATDVITFAGDARLGHAGEICVSADAARAFARRHHRDFSAELTLYLVHGWLHLAGHDDRDPAAKRRMRAAEARAMRSLDAAGAIPRFRLA